MPGRQEGYGGQALLMRNIFNLYPKCTENHCLNTIRQPIPQNWNNMYKALVKALFVNVDLPGCYKSPGHF